MEPENKKIIPSDMINSLHTDAVLSSVDLGGTEADEIELISFASYSRNFCLYDLATKKTQPFDYLIIDEFKNLVNETIDTKAIESIKIEHIVRVFEKKIAEYKTTTTISDKVVFIDSFVSNAESIGFDNTVKLIMPLIYDIMNEKKIVISAFFEGFPKIIDFLNKKSPDGYNLIKDKLIPLVGDALVNQKDGSINDFCQSALVSAAKLLLPDDHVSSILSILLDLANKESEPINLITAMSLFNSLAPIIKAQITESYIIPVIISFSESKNLEVKLSILKNLTNICQCINQKIIETKILQVYYKLAKDEPDLRKAACDVLPQIAKYCNKELINKDLYELFCFFVKDLNAIVHYSALVILGEFINMLSPDKLTDDLLTFYTTKILANYNKKDYSIDKDTNYKIAYTFPSVLMLYTKTKWEQLRPVYSYFLHDQEKKVKKTIANSISEVAKLLGPELVESDLLKLYNEFFTSNDNEIKVILLKSLPLFASIITSDINKIVLLDNLKVINNGNEKLRNKKIYSVILGKLKGVYDDKTVYKNILPLLLKLCFENAAILREKAATQLGHLLNQLLLSDKEKIQKNAMSIIESFATCINYQYRKLFISIIKQIIIFNKEVFDKMIYCYLVDLAFDKLDQVRIVIAKFISKQWAKLEWMAKDEKWIQLVNTLKKDNSVYVRNYLNNIVPVLQSELNPVLGVNSKFTNKMEFLRDQMGLKIIQLGINEGNRILEEKGTVKQFD